MGKKMNWKNKLGLKNTKNTSQPFSLGLSVFGSHLGIFNGVFF